MERNNIGGGDTNYMDITCKAPLLFNNVTGAQVVPSLVVDILWVLMYVYGTLAIISVLFVVAILIALPFIFIWESFDEIADAFPRIAFFQLGKYFD